MEALAKIFTDVSVDHDKESLIVAGQEMAKQIIESGMMDNVEVACRTAQMNTLFQAFFETMKDQARKEISGQADPKTQYGNVTVGVRSTGDRIQYDKDPVIQERKKLIKAVKEAPQGAHIVDQNGEVVEMPPITVGKETITFKQK